MSKVCLSWLMWKPWNMTPFETDIFLSYNWLYVFTQPLRHKQDVSKGQFLSGIQFVWIQFSLSLTSCHTTVKEPSLSYYLLMAGRRIIGFIPFPKVLVLSERQTVSSRIWTWIAMSFPATITIMQWVHTVQCMRSKHFANLIWTFQN